MDYIPGIELPTIIRGTDQTLDSLEAFRANERRRIIVFTKLLESNPPACSHLEIADCFLSVLLLVEASFDVLACDPVSLCMLVHR